MPPFASQGTMGQVSHVTQHATVKSHRLLRRPVALILGVRAHMGEDVRDHPQWQELGQVATRSALVRLRRLLAREVVMRQTEVLVTPPSPLAVVIRVPVAIVGVRATEVPAIIITIQFRILGLGGPEGFEPPHDSSG